MSIRQGNKVIAGHINYHPDLFDHKWTDHLLNDVSWLRADTFSWQDGGVYEAAYDHLEADITGKSLSSEMISGVTVQFYLADDGHKICPASEESNVASIFTATGVAWYYIIDTVNERFKLPRTQYGFDGFRDTVGKYIEPGLPNITGTLLNTYDANNSGQSGAFANGAIVSDNGFGFDGNSHSTTRATNFNASRSSSIYGASTTVQAPATQQYLYFYVGNFTQTAVENTAGLNASLFNNKLDLDVGNATSTTKETVVGWELPDYTAGVSVASGYTATTKCWLFAHTSGDGGSGTAGSAYVYVNGTAVVGAWVSSWNYQTINDVFVPLDVGDVVTSSATRGTATMTIYPMKGV